MKFSIVTPTYNREKTIERAVESILSQTFQNFEMLIVDDGSTDSTLDVLKKYSNDSRIKVIESINNGGVNVARNIGLKNVSNDVDWITFLDSDDEFTLDALQNIKLTIESNPSINYFRFPVKYANGTYVSDTSLFNTSANYEKYVSHMDTCGEWVVVFNRKILQDGFLYDERVRAFESLSWLALVMKENVFYGDFVVRLYHLDVESISRPSNKSIEYYKNLVSGFSLILVEHGEALTKWNQKFYVLYLYELANLNIIVGNSRVGFELLMQVMKYDFLNVGLLRFFKNVLIKRF
jgi:glycosyltransferase involved in cell wall biosynthesis